MTTLKSPLRLAFETRVAPPSFRLQLLIEPFRGPINGRTLKVDGDLLIGREPTADVTLAGALISRRHVLVRAVHDGLEIEDISSHGTLVNGETLRLTRRRVGRECTLHVGCVCLWLRRVLPSDTDPIDLRATREADSDYILAELDDRS